MKIELLKTTPDRAGRYWLRFEDGSSLGLYRQTVEDFGLYAGKELNEKEMEHLRSAAGKMSAKMRAVRIVSASSISKRELQRRLEQKGEDPDQAREAVQWMEDLDLLDDCKTAEQIVYRCIQKGYGLSRAKQALYEKRIPKGIWDQVLEDYPDQSDKIIEFLRSRLDADSDEKEVKRAIEALLRRGHSYGAIRQGLNEIKVDFEEIPEE